MFEHVGLQEAYTGALIAGKGRQLNNIPIIMERLKMPYATWARVRFGAGTPWRRCWCVVSPPDEKEVQKVQKLLKKKSPYDRSRPPVLKGDVNFYDTKKTKRTRPIATITDAYSAFAIYPQSKPLIDKSTLIKVEGSITIHSSPPTVSEGFVFVMPEVPPAVTGFEIMLRWLFPVMDTFALYGRPGKLIADTLDQKGLMFAMPKHCRYGYLEILDITSLVLEDGSSNWKEAEWRRKMKELTARRMTAIESASASQRNSRYSTRRSRNSFGPSRSRVQFDDAASSRSTPAVSWSHEPPPQDVHPTIPRVDSAPAGVSGFTAPHHRSVSEAQGLDRLQTQAPPMYDGAQEQAPVPPPHTVPVVQPHENASLKPDKAPTPERVSSEDEHAARASPVRELQDLQTVTSPEPVAAPPAFSHGPGAIPASRPYHSPELRRANSRMSTTTLSQLAGAGGAVISANDNDPNPSNTKDQGISTGDHPASAQEQGVQEHSLQEQSAQEKGSQEQVSQEQHNQAHGAQEQGNVEEQTVADIHQESEDTGQSGVRLNVKTNEHPANRDGLHQGPIKSSYPRRSLEQRSSPTTNSELRSVGRPSKPLINPFISQEANSRPHRTIFPIQSSSPDNRFHSAQPSTPETSSSPIRNREPKLQGVASAIDVKPDQSPRLQGSHSIARKPLGTPPSDSHMSTFPPRLSSSKVAIQPRNVAQQSPIPSHMFQPRGDIRDCHDESASSASEEYSSAKQSFEVERSPDRPRAGVLKTVGQTESEARYHNERQQLDSPLNINFGPTLNYASQRLPGEQSPARASAASPNQSPRGGNRNPGNAGAVRTAAPQSPEKRPNSSENTIWSNRDVITPDNQHARPGSSRGRSMQWQPGMNAVSNRPRSMTPEEFVQQRAAAANTPLYAHQRQASSRDFNRSTTPDLHSRHSSYDLLQRPSSRGSSMMLGSTAQEQEYMTKLSGQPLVNMAQNNRPGPPGGGLVGAIEARAQEKQLLKRGLNEHAVDQAYIRNQQAQYQQQSEQRNFQSPYGNIQFGGQLPMQRQQTWAPQGFGGFNQGWSTSDMGQPEHPRTYPLPQQPFFDQHPQYPQQQHWGQGRGNQRYGDSGR